MSTQTNDTQPNARRQAIQRSLVETHGLEPYQISFADDDTPIFDYEAVSLLALKLTDIKDMECVTERIDLEKGVVTARGQVTLPDGRTRTTSASAVIGERLASGEFADKLFQAEAVANSRAARRVVRSVGVNLWKAHLAFIETGEITEGHNRTSDDRVLSMEIHAYAHRLGLIAGKDRSRYEDFLAAAFDGRISSTRLTQEEKHRLIDLLRTMSAGLAFSGQQ